MTVHDVTVLRADGVDRYGDRTRETAHTESGASVKWTGFETSPDNPERTIRTGELVFFNSVDIQDQDRVRLDDGKHYSVTGVRRAEARWSNRVGTVVYIKGL